MEYNTIVVIRHGDLVERSTSKNSENKSFVAKWKPRRKKGGFKIKWEPVKHQKISQKTDAGVPPDTVITSIIAYCLQSESGIEL